MLVLAINDGCTRNKPTDDTGNINTHFITAPEAIPLVDDVTTVDVALEFAYAMVAFPRYHENNAPIGQNFR